MRGSRKSRSFRAFLILGAQITAIFGIYLFFYVFYLSIWETDFTEEFFIILEWIFEYLLKTSRLFGTEAVERTLGNKFDYGRWSV